MNETLVGYCWLKEMFFCLFFLNLFIYFIYFWLCWVFVSVLGLPLVAASGGHSSSRCAGLSLSWTLLLRSTGSRRAGSVVVAHGPSCSAACEIFPDQGSNPCPCIGRQILNHCTTREAQETFLKIFTYLIQNSAFLILQYTALCKMAHTWLPVKFYLSVAKVCYL